MSSAHVPKPYNNAARLYWWSQRRLQPERDARGMGKDAPSKAFGVSREMIGRIQEDDSLPGKALGAFLWFDCEWCRIAHSLCRHNGRAVLLICKTMSTSSSIIDKRDHDHSIRRSGIRPSDEAARFADEFALMEVSELASQESRNICPS